MGIIKQNKDKIFLFFIISFILYIVFSPYVKELLVSLLIGNKSSIDKAFIIESDWIAQHIPFYKEFFRQIDSGKIGWSWNELFGINFYGSKGYYLIGDPFAWVTYIFYKILDNLHFSLLLITLIKFYISAYTFYSFLQRRKVNRSGCFIFSIMFMLSGWQTLFLEHPVYTSFYCITPLVLIGLEKILLRKSYPLFIISSALMLSINYYLSWMFCWFILIYWIVRFIEINEESRFKNFVNMSLKILVSFFIAIAISAIVWIPSVLHMLESPRIDHELISYYSWTSDNILSIIMNFFVPITKENNLYQFYWYYFYQIGIYCGVLNVLLLPQLFINNKISKSYQVMVILILSTLLSPISGKLFHFTYSLRYSLIIEYMLLICGSIIYTNIRHINNRILWITELLILVILSILGICIPYIRGLDISGYPQARMLLYCSLFSVFYCLLIKLAKKNKKIAVFGIFFFVMCELISQSRIVVQSQVANLGSRAEYLYKEEELKKVVNALKNYDSSFYRIYLDFGELNAGLYYGIPVPKTYDSVYEYNNYDFLNYIRTYPDFNWNFDINDSALFERLNIKYAILGSDVDETNYFYIGKKLSLPVDSEFKVFQVSEFAAMMRSENKFVSSEKIELMSLADQDYFLYEITELLATNCIVQENESQYNKIYSKSEIIYGNPVEWNNNSMRFELELKEDSFLYFSIPNDRGWKVYDNGKRIDKINVNGGFIGLEIPKGKHRVEFVYTVPGWVLGILITLGGIIMLIVIVVNDINLKKRR